MNEMNDGNEFRFYSKRTDLKQRWAFLAKWIWGLFWICIAQTTVVSVLMLLGLWPAGSIVGVAYGVVLLKISSQEGEYRKAGMQALAVEGISLVAFVSRQTFLMVLLIIAFMIMSRCYHEFNAHATMLEELDEKLSQQWRKLWTWILSGSLAIVVGVIFLLFPIGQIVVGVGAIMILSTNFFKLIWLFRTARAFQRVAAS